MLNKSYKVQPSQSQHAVAEFGKGQRGVLICSDCGAAYFKKRWFHDIGKIKLSDNDRNMKFLLCPACTMVKNGQYEGRLIIKNISTKSAKELENLIVGFCQRAYERDPMDRLIAINKNQSAWTVTVTENQLANKLAKKIKDSFNKVKTATYFAGDPSDVAEVLVEFA